MTGQVYLDASLKHFIVSATKNYGKARIAQASAVAGCHAGVTDQLIDATLALLSHALTSCRLASFSESSLGTLGAYLLS
jgi:hypothetical protein